MSKDKPTVHMSATSKSGETVSMTVPGDEGDQASQDGSVQQSSGRQVIEGGKVVRDDKSS